MGATRGELVSNGVGRTRQQRDLVLRDEDAAALFLMSDYPREEFDDLPLFQTRAPREDQPRVKGQALAILQRLRKGPVLNTELNEIAFRYSARLHELDQMGYRYAKQRVAGKRGVFEYRLISEPKP